MPAIAAMVLADSVPANITFNPADKDSAGVATFLTSDAVFDAKKKVTLSVTLAKSSGSVHRVKQKYVVPVMDPVDSSLKIGECIVNIDMALPKVSTQTNRLDVLAFAKAGLAHANTTAAVQNLENVY